MLHFLLFFTISLISAQQTTTRSCYTCATTDLKNKWYLTGLAPVPDSFFAPDCANRASKMTSDSCAGPCLTLVFDNPDEVGGNQPATTYVVRGCHRTLTQVVTDRFNNNNNNNNNQAWCEIDKTYRMSDRKGNIVPVRMMAMMCSDTSLCNDNEFIPNDFTNGVTCANQTNENLLNNTPLNCYECLPSAGYNCHDSKCTKKYCMKQQVKIDGGYQLMKSCSDVNYLGIDNTCQTYDVQTTPGGIPLKSELTQCFCKNKQFCNSSNTKIGFFIIFSIIIYYIQ